MATKIWWLIHKDLLIEYRTRQAWLSMLLLGIIVAVVFSLQMEVLPAQRPAVTGGLLWLAIVFAGLVAIEQARAGEQADGCWDGLLLYPLPPAAIYFTKVVVNAVELLALAWVLVPLFIVLADVPLLRHGWPMLLVSVLGSISLAAVGTVVGVLTDGVRQRRAVLSVLLLPLVIPVVLAAAEATRLIAEDRLVDEWWRWIQFLGAFAVIFVTVGGVVFGLLVEE